MTLRRSLKAVLTALAIVATCPCALCSWLEQRFTEDRESCFLFCAHLLSLVPGLPGSYLRRAYYWQTLNACALDCNIGFGAIFTHREASVSPSVYVGDGARIGVVTLERGCLVGSGASLLSGGQQHTLDDAGKWTSCDRSKRTRIRIGPDTWIGEKAVVMADVGRTSMICAGSVVASRVPDHVMVAGNPARFVRRLTCSADRSEDDRTPRIHATSCDKE